MLVFVGFAAVSFVGDRVAEVKVDVETAVAEEEEVEVEVLLVFVFVFEFALDVRLREGIAVEIGKMLF